MNFNYGDSKMSVKKAILVIGLILLLAAEINSAESDTSANSTWNGQYIGFTVGASKGMANPMVQAKGTGYFVTTDPGQVNPQGSQELDGSDFRGSLLWGINRQRENLVFGIEAEFSLTNFNETYNSGNIAYLTVPATTFSMNTEVTSRWAASIRPRLGYARNASLFYITAGPAFTEVKYNFFFSDTNGPESVSLSNSDVKLGWAAGFGYEYKLKKGWVLTTGYLYSKFKNIVDASSALQTVPADGFIHEVDYETHDIRVGLVYQF